MKILVYFLWVFVGFGLAVLYVKSQQWTVSLIDPHYPKNSKRLIVGGAIFRWLTISLILLFTIHHSIESTLILFCSFMIARIVIMVRLQSLIA